MRRPPLRPIPPCLSLLLFALLLCLPGCGDQDAAKKQADAKPAEPPAVLVQAKKPVVADVPVSLFLSGGLDSSAVAHEIVNCGANIKDAYTIAVSSNDRRVDGQGDDLFFAGLMARKIGLDLRVIRVHQDYLLLLRVWPLSWRMVFPIPPPLTPICFPRVLGKRGRRSCCPVRGQTNISEGTESMWRNASSGGSRAPCWRGCH